MKVVINKCYGGFGLSALATKMLAEKEGKECYFFRHDWDGAKRKYYQVTQEDVEKSGLFWDAFSVPNPNDYKLDGRDEDGSYKTVNKNYDSINIYYNSIDRTDSNLISIIEELGEKANGSAAKLEIVETPDDIEWVIEEYDGIEWISEKHRTWE